MVATRPAGYYTVPPDVWGRWQGFLIIEIWVGSKLLVLHVGIAVVLGLQRWRCNVEVYGGRIERGKLWGRAVFTFPVVEPCYVVDWSGP